MDASELERRYFEIIARCARVQAQVIPMTEHTTPGMLSETRIDQLRADGAQLYLIRNDLQAAERLCTELIERLVSVTRREG